MEYYAKSIRKFQRELKKSVSEFLQFGPLGRTIAVTNKDLNNTHLSEQKGHFLGLL